VLGGAKILYRKRVINGILDYIRILKILMSDPLVYSQTTVQEDIPYHFRKGMVCQFSNGMVCPPATSVAGAKRPRSISNLWTLVSN
jgi:hypothetical protein